MPPVVTDQSITRNLNRNLLIDDSLVVFEFKPSVGIAAGRMDKLGMDIRSFREPLKRVVQQVMAPSFLKNFDQGGRPEAWEPLSDATLEIRKHNGISSDRPLIRTGLLRKTMGQLNIWTITSTNATIQGLPSKVKYGGIHQAGYEGGGVGKKMSSYFKRAGGDAKVAARMLDADLIKAMRSGQTVAGASRTTPAIPQRQFVLVQEEDYDKISEVFHQWFRERAAARGFLAT